MFRNYPELWFITFVYIVVAAGILCYLLQCRDCFICNKRTGWKRSLLLAAVIAPSFITDFFVAAAVVPAGIGIVFVAGTMIFSPDLMPGLLLFSLLAYIAPWLLVSTLIFGIWTLLGRRSQQNQIKDASSVKPRRQSESN
jgi:hypothetical protein